MACSGFKTSVQPKNDFSVKKSSRKTYFSKKKVGTLLEIALFQIQCIFTTVTWAKIGKNNIESSASFDPKKSKNEFP